MGALEASGTRGTAMQITRLDHGQYAIWLYDSYGHLGS